jgi:hypothetical protein
MDFIPIFAPILGIGVLIERILEVIWDVAGPYTRSMKEENPEQYRWLKVVGSIVIGMVIGVIVSTALKLTFFDGLVETAIDPGMDRVVTGLIAGASAPYVHQIIELLMNTQKFMETKKDQIEGNVAAENGNAADG